MSSSIFTPSNQIRLTNVSVVRLKKTGKRFELACYKNKVIDYRNKTTKNLDDVLQTRAIFTNVSKGQLARKEDLQAAFPEMETDSIILQILDKGEIQVGEKERDAQLDSLHREVTNIISGKCVNPSTRTPYPPALIEKALASIHFAPNPNKSAKQQALECIRTLSQSNEFPIARARMRLVVELPADSSIPDMAALFSAVESEECGDGKKTYRVLIEPANYKKITELVTKNKGTVHIESLRELKEQEYNYL